jgi:hypothetical protein
MMSDIAERDTDKEVHKAAKQGSCLVPYQEAGLTLHPLKVFAARSSSIGCNCFSCNDWTESTWALSYFVNHGLNIEVSTVRSFTRLSVPVLAQIYSIVARRNKAVSRVFSLEEWAAFTVFKHCPSTKGLKLPARFRKSISEIHPYLSDIIDWDLSRERGYSIFKPWRAARFFLRHLGRYVLADQMHFDKSLQDVDWFQPPVAYRQSTRHPSGQ